MGLRRSEGGYHRPALGVMPGLDPGIHALLALSNLGGVRRGLSAKARKREGGSAVTHRVIVSYESLRWVTALCA